MVFESLLSARAAEEKPLFDFFFGVVLSLVSFVSAYFLFPGIASLVSIVLLSIGLVPVLLKIFYYENESENALKGWKKIFQVHSKALRFFLMFFLGVSFTVAILYTYLPKYGFSEVSDRLFSEERNEILAITESVGNAGMFSGLFSNPTTAMIVQNNLIVLMASFILSLIFGGGAAFVLAWNSAVFGVFLAIAFERNPLYLPFALLYALPELVAYYVGAFSGGLLSAEFSKVFSIDAPDERTKRMKPSLSLVVNSAILLLGAAALIVFMGIFEGFLISL